MHNIRRRTTRAILVPVALFAIVIAGALPVSAGDTGNSAPTVTTVTAPVYVIGPLSLRW